MYGYLDDYGILHVTDDSSDGKFSVETSITGKGGFPLINGKQAYVYSLDEAYLGGNRNSYKAKPRTADKINLDEYPELKKLYIDCYAQGNF